MSLITPEFGLLFWMVLIFALVFFILAKFGFPVISSAVRKRSDYIGDSLKAADEARASLENLAVEQQKLIEQTRIEQARILKEASETRAQIISKAREDAEAEAARVMERTKAEIAAEKEHAMLELRAAVSSVSLAVAEKLVRGSLSEDAAQTALLDRLAGEAAETALKS